MRHLTRVVGDYGNINIFTNYYYVHTEIRLQSSRIFLQIDRVAAILRIHCNRKLFTLNLMNFYYREFITKIGRHIDLEVLITKISTVGLINN